MTARKIYILSGGQISIDLDSISPIDYFEFSEAYSSIIREIGAIFLAALLAVHSPDKGGRREAAQVIFGKEQPKHVRSRKALVKVIAKQQVKRMVAERLGAK